MASLHSVGLRRRVVSVACNWTFHREAKLDSLAQEAFDGRESLLLLRVGETELVAEALSYARFRQFPRLPDSSYQSEEHTHEGRNEAEELHHGDVAADARTRSVREDAAEII